ncbi:polyamine-transporting ATPase 13A3-like isoform X1 [Bolinopsis microptera]|uniref:polyamine-transporting ATPase 13A3-like isoform X1 n=1 Tax=Bolinopsis microptera TaxID=2820187 RepID=UPI003078E20E
MITVEESEDRPLMDHVQSQTISDDSSSKYKVTGLRTSIPKLLLTIILTICSGGFLLLVMHWYPKVNVILTKKKSKFGTATYIHIISCDTEIHGVANVKDSDGIRYFKYQHSKYIFECGEISLVNGLENLHYSDIHAMSGGVSDSVLDYKLMRYGPNVIDVPVPSYIVLFFKEALQPFYIFQAFAVVLWMWDDYEQYATAILIITLGSIAITIYEQRKQKNKINKMAASSVEVEVLRNGENAVLQSSDLVPGDVILIPRDGFLLSCDAVLVSGSAIVNECALTGESIPVSKAPVPYISKFIYESGDVEKVTVSEDLIYNPERDKKYSLLAGTTVLQSKPTSGTNAVAIVMRTGFSTFKGSLIRSILCPKPTQFEFQADAQRFIMMLSFFAVLGFTYTVYISLKLGATISKTVRLGLDLVTVVVPPALPAALTIGVVYAVQRLKKSKIFCIDPQRVNFCGKIQYICFDKTGTLTEDGLSVLCAIPSSSIFLGATSEGHLIKQEMFLHALATCHEISIINGEYIGDPLDIEMFEFTGWTFEECDELNPLASFVSAIVSSPERDGEDDADPKEIGIIRSFPFTSELQRMCVVTKNLQTDEMILFCKGSPEMIHSLSLESTIPGNFHSELDSYTNEGYRVIAFGWKVLDSETSWHSIQTMRRSELECDLNFTGLLIMENHLKGDTTGCISELMYSNTKVCMVTGDNIFTAISVSKKCGIVPINGGLHDVIVVKKEGQSVAFQLDSQEQTSVILPTKYSQMEIVNTIIGLTSRPFVFAIAETAFNHVAEFHPLLYELLLLKGKVFARMKPGKKQKLVEDLQKIGYTVSMCGDGANDCGALKSAHAGVSLSEAEASIAAPFTSANPSISCMIEILRQGRAALVTASVTFRFMAMYSMIQFITQLLHYSIGTNMTDSQFLYIDMFVISGIAVTLGHSQPAPNLAPSTPKAQLIDFKVFVLLTLHVIITFGFQFFVFMLLQTYPFYDPNADSGNYPRKCLENTAVFIISQSQYAIYGVVLCQGHPFRRPAYRNWTLMLVFFLCTVMTVLFVFQPLPFLTKMMNLVSLQQLDVQITFILLMALNFVLVYLVEELFDTNRVTGCLNGVKIFLNKAKPQFVTLREVWEDLFSNDFNSKNFYK